MPSEFSLAPQSSHIPLPTFFLSIPGRFWHAKVCGKEGKPSLFLLLGVEKKKRTE
jgi:hypothetical protein